MNKDNKILEVKGNTNFKESEPIDYLKKLKEIEVQQTNFLERLERFQNQLKN